MLFELRDVSCGYDENKPVLSRISMTLKDGEICCILGPNGVGKTTLFKTILGMLPLRAGSMSIDGQDITQWNAKKRSQTIAYVAQAHVPAFPYKAEDMVMLGRIGQVSRFSQPTRHDFEIVERAMYDMGIDYLHGKAYTDISGGERQLLMIAKALAQEPDLLLLDEPTANLDFGNMAHVLAKMNELAESGLCILFTSHLPDQAFLCKSKAALLMRGEPMLFGSCDLVVTEANLEHAYHAPVQVAEIIGEDGRPLRLVAPKLSDLRDRMRKIDA